MIVWLVAWRHQPRLAVLLSPFVLGLIVATVYGRFHYLLDTLAGFGLAVTVVAIHGRLSIARKIHCWFTASRTVD